MTKREKKAHTWDRDPYDWYLEPRFIWDRLFRTADFEAVHEVYDPACGICTVLDAARDAGLDRRGSDIVPRWRSINHEGHEVFERDFMTSRGQAAWPKSTAICSNPPFGCAREFAIKALGECQGMVALLLPAKWACGDERSRWLESTPLKRMLLVTPRPSMPPGAAVMAGEKPGNGTTDFAVFLWSHAHEGAPTLGWLRR